MKDGIECPTCGGGFYTYWASQNMVGYYNTFESHTTWHTWECCMEGVKIWLRDKPVYVVVVDRDRLPVRKFLRRGSK